jgi:hypothetical protein
MAYTEQDWSSLAVCVSGTGLEFDWFAVDRSGYLGVFATAGEGPIPAGIWQHREAYNKLSEECLSLPATRLFEKFITASGDFGDWWRFAAQGLFAFDYRDVHRVQSKRSHCYELIARPHDMVPAGSLLPALDIDWMPRINIDFQSHSFIPNATIQSA